MHHLGAVDEIAVLRLPDHEPARLLDVVAELEPDGRELGERTVVNLEGGAGVRQGLERNERAVRFRRRETRRDDG